MVRALFQMTSFMVFCSILIWPQSVLGGFSLTIGTTPLSNNSINQKISMFLSWDGSGSSDVAGMNVFSEIQNPNLNSTVPVFQGSLGSRTAFGYSNASPTGGTFAATSSTIWDSIPDTFSVSGSAPESGNARRASVAVLSNNLSSFDFASIPNSPRLIGELAINTTGVFDSSYTLFFGVSGGSSTDVVFSDASSFAIPNTVASFTVGNITAVPEPSSLLGTIALACGGLWYVRRCSIRKRRSHTLIHDSLN